MQIEKERALEMISGYPSIHHLGHRDIADLFNGPVRVEEKIDGSQFSFAKIDGYLRFKSKGAEVSRGDPHMFKAIVDHLVEREQDVQEGIVFRGEFLQKPKHNLLAYDRTPRGHLALFDVQGEATWSERSTIEMWAEHLDLEAIPLLHDGVIESREELVAMLDRVSVLGGQKIEGVIIKRMPLVGKLVGEAFKEVRSSKGGKTGGLRLGDPAEDIGERYRCEARWRKAIQHLRDENRLSDDPRDIGPLIKEIHADIQKECREEIVEALIKEFMPRVLKRTIIGFPEWYKDQLTRQQFEGEG